jgi:hypothetical protein
MMWIPFLLITILLTVMVFTLNAIQYKAGHTYMAIFFSVLYFVMCSACFYVVYLIFTQDQVVKQVVKTFGGF